MPKTTTKNGTTFKHEQSPKKRNKATSQTETADAHQPASGSTAQVIDPSQWRASKLRESDTITKSEAIRQYRLREGDFEGIPFRTEQTVARGRFLTSMYIYKERDIERKAWERRGGPEAFDKYIAERRATYLKTNPNSYFPQPSTYEDPRGGVYVVSIKPGIPRGSGSGDPYVGKSPTLLSIKNQMAPWLWTAYNKALLEIDDLNWESVGLSGRGFFTSDRARDREGPMKDALVLSRTYPPRPTEPLLPSPSMDKVRAVLGEAASAPKGKDWGREDIPGLTFVSSQPEDVEEYYWSEDYLERLFSALIEVIDEHGMGPEGLEGIRWEVYDKHVACMHAGPHYDRHDGVWTDEAAEWLDGQLAEIGIQMDVSWRGKCSAGRRFNDMLARRNPGGYASVGFRLFYLVEGLARTGCAVFTF